jgi:hypothetical protein
MIRRSALEVRCLTCGADANEDCAEVRFHEDNEPDEVFPHQVRQTNGGVKHPIFWPDYSWQREKIL